MSSDPRFIIDSSITMTWCFSDESTPRTDALLDRLRHERVLVPSIWPLEIVNVLITCERKGHISQNDSANFVNLLRSLPISVDSVPEIEQWNNTLMLGRSQNLTAYDAAYLKLAVRTGLPFATLDNDLIKAANALQLVLI